jgi:hypothetical protein
MQRSDIAERLWFEVTLDGNNSPRRVREVVDLGRDTEDLYDADRIRRVLCVSVQLLPRNKAPQAPPFDVSVGLEGPFF